MTEAEYKKRISELEEVLKDVPQYIDNWQWAEDNFDVLKTIPEFQFPNHMLEDRWEKEKALCSPTRSE